MKPITYEEFINLSMKKYDKVVKSIPKNARHSTIVNYEQFKWEALIELVNDRLRKITLL